MVTKKLINSFKFAFEGLWYCIKNERNFRIHICAAIFTYLLSSYYNFSYAEMIMLTLVIAVVIITEMLNTTIETIVDMVSPNYNYLAKKAKDISAGAVLMSAFCSIICSIFLFLKPNVLIFILNDIMSSYIKIAVAAIVVILMYLFVRGFGKKNV